MIRQHYLQQQRLNNNHDRLLQRYQRILPPQISEFRTFGRSSLPGRNYDQYINTMNGNQGRRDSLVAQSRAGIGLSNETYRLMGDGTSEILPRNISSIMQHTRQQPSQLVHAEKFEPVKFYEHPVFGPTPAYVRPVYNERQQREQARNKESDSESDSEDDNEVRSHTSRNTSSKVTHQEERKNPSPKLDDSDDDDDSDHAPKGYISYKKWKAKHENLIPVNPLLYNIYTHRPNGSVNSYGQSLYASSDRLRALIRDEDVSTPTISDVGSESFEAPRPISSSTNQRYHKLQTQLFPKTTPSQSRGPLRPDSDDELSDDESSPPDSPVPYLSQKRTNPIPLTPFPTTIPSAPITGTTPSSPPILNTSGINTPGTSSSPLTSTIPPAPPMPPSLISTSSTHTYQTPSSLPISSPPIAPPMPPALLTSSTNTFPTPSNPPTSLPPIAPPMPASLLSTNTYQTPSSLRTTFPSAAPSIPGAFSTTSSTGIYQTPSSVSGPLPSTSSLYNPPAKAVTFGGSSAIVVPNNDVSSSTDSDDDAQKKRRRRKKRQTAGGGGADADSSSDD